ncbi:CopD family protein [Halomonas sp. LR5S13]|uniref:CopD family protein n=1 Tax=Halomonas rhizosphaerae TaxID=3043296 RepID=UPI0024A836E9|nr:CopD family protein [Halomonas rhizosphaerae]MDI5921121.1 CopD family protein [Halomonas rhizosphaerae]
MSLAITLHLLAATIWVGGMFFAWMILRPVAVELLEPPQRLTLWYRAFQRFFPWVWAAVVVLLATGLWMLFGVFGGMGSAGVHVHLMLVSGLAMMAIFLHIWFAPYPRLGRAVAGEDWPAGGQQLGQIRRLIGINLILGLATVAIASGGRFL